MEPWRALAIEFFPEMESMYQQPEETVWSVFFDFRHGILEEHYDNKANLFDRIFKYAEWCHSQMNVEPELWTAAFAGFYEHLVEDEETYRVIPQRVKPAIVREMLAEWRDRLDNKAKYPGETPGTFRGLLQKYDEVNGTSFTEEQDWP